MRPRFGARRKLTAAVEFALLPLPAGKRAVGANLARNPGERRSEFRLYCAHGEAERTGVVCDRVTERESCTVAAPDTWEALPLRLNDLHSGQSPRSRRSLRRCALVCGAGADGPLRNEGREYIHNLNPDAALFRRIEPVEWGDEPGERFARLRFAKRPARKRRRTEAKGRIARREFDDGSHGKGAAADSEGIRALRAAHSEGAAGECDGGQPRGGGGAARSLRALASTFRARR